MSEVPVYQSARVDLSGAEYAEADQRGDAWREYASIGDLTAAENLDLRDLRLVYQPLVDVIKGKIVAFEALLRWDHPVLGELIPRMFLDKVLASSRLPDVTLTVVKSAFEQLKAWRSAGIADVRLAVNVSVPELELTGVAEAIAACAVYAGIQPNEISLEVSERGSVLACSKALDAIRALHAYGFQISIDDFGAGEASLRYLLELPISEIKLDQSLIAGSPSRRHETVIVDIARLADHLGHALVVEGVQCREHLNFLIENGIRLAQGYYLGPPVPPALASAWFSCT